jgi:hypothetical protein
MEGISMNAPGKTMLKVSSILLIVLGSLGVLCSICVGCSLLLVNVMPMDQIKEQLPESTIAMWNAAKGGITPLIIIGQLVGGFANLLQLILGIIGFKNCGKPEKGPLFVGMGVALIATYVACMIFRPGFSFVTALLSLALPILFIVGGVKNNKAADTPVEYQQ